jgi:glycosyltransferase involved in cell wall biosynthesis
VPPRIAFWTSAYAPEMEAVSGQVALLRKNFPKSVAWGLNDKCPFQVSWRRGLVFHPRLWLPFRGATWLLQRAFQINHIYGGPGDWHYLRAALKHPIVMTVAVRSSPCDVDLLRRVDRFVVEWPRDLELFRNLDIDPLRVEVIPPPVDLQRFQPTARPRGPLTALFASSPVTISGLEERGVDAILHAASLRPDYRFRLLWRPWGDSYEHLATEITRRRLDNVHLIRNSVERMEQVYAEIHLTLAPFRDPTNTKGLPNSLIESLACGRPIITSTAVSFGADVEDARAGRVTPVTGEALVAAMSSIDADWQEMSAAAAAFAANHFSHKNFITSHRRLYLALVARYQRPT